MGIGLAVSGSMSLAVSGDRIAAAILLIRGRRVLLDVDLAALYEVDTRALNQAVRRNLDRFPPDFMFQLTREGGAFLRSQVVTLKPGVGATESTCPSRSPSKAWPCCPACCAPNEPFA